MLIYTDFDTGIELYFILPGHTFNSDVKLKLYVGLRYQLPVILVFMYILYFYKSPGGVRVLPSFPFSDAYDTLVSIVVTMSVAFPACHPVAQTHNRLLQTIVKRVHFADNELYNFNCAEPHLFTIRFRR